MSALAFSNEELVKLFVATVFDSCQTSVISQDEAYNILAGFTLSQRSPGFGLPVEAGLQTLLSAWAAGEVSEASAQEATSALILAVITKPPATGSGNVSPAR